MEDYLQLFGWRDLADIAAATVLFWGAILWLRRTRALPAFVGLAILGVVYLGAYQLGLQLTARIFQAFSAALLVLVVVVFQGDLRRLLEQIGAWGLRRKRRQQDSTTRDALVHVVQRLARTRNGALIILPGRESLDRHLEGGVQLSGQLSEPLLLSLFDPHSPGHDGAVVVEGNTVTRFAVRLPLSSAEEQLRDVGTRHAAALGLSERCDALVLVVSEERGAISVAQGGSLRRLAGSQELGAVLARFHEEVTPHAGPRPRLPRILAAQWKPILLALTLASVLWGLLGPAAQIVEEDAVAQVLLENLPPGYVLESVTPGEISVTLSGPRRRLSLAQDDNLRIRVDATLAKLGRRTFQLNPSQVDTPRGIRPLQVTPTTVRVSLKTSPSGGSN